MRTRIISSLVLAAALTLAPSAHATGGAPPDLAVPDGNHVVARHHATGFQVYQCQREPNGALAWKLRAPLAALHADDGELVAIHYGGVDVGFPAGPYWQSTLDGSRVHGGNPLSVPNPGAIPLLRLEGLDTAGEGIFDGVTFIQRLATVGGLPPAGPCRRENVRAYVPYRADYVFFAGSLPRPEVPDLLTVPDGHDVASVGQASGDQIYECVADTAGVPAWRLRAPSALLTDEEGETFADHFGGVDAGLPAGPYWRSLRDDSRVHGGNAVPSPVTGTIPLLRLQALDTAGNGIFSRVSYIQRLATSGGVAPSTPCALGDRAPVAYTADYYFYVPVN